MKFFVSVILFFSALCSSSFADRYLLVMSKDDDLCQYILKMYNDDLDKHGRLILENHPEYNFTEWKSMDVNDGYGDYTYAMI